MKETTGHYKSTLLIQAPPEVVWHALTDTGQMKAWMAEPEMQMEISASWRVGEPVTISGFHHVPFDNRGKVLVFEKPHRLSYTHLSSLSNLPDEMQNHAVLSFTLAKEGEGTLLTLSISNCLTTTIFKHLEFYWNTTLHALKQHTENS